MAWCHQSTSYYLSQYWPWSVASLGYSELTHELFMQSTKNMVNISKIITVDTQLWCLLWVQSLVSAKSFLHELNITCRVTVTRAGYRVDFEFNRTPHTSPSAVGSGTLSTKRTTSYRKILWSLEAAWLDVIMFISLWNLIGISAALLSRCLSNFRAIGKVYTRISRLRVLTRSCGKTSVCSVNRGQGVSSEEDFLRKNVGVIRGLCYKEAWLCFCNSIILKI